MKVTILVGGRWHAFDLAKGLRARGALNQLVTNYPWFKLKAWGFARNDIISLTTSQWLQQVVSRGLPTALRVRFQYFIHSHFARAAMHHINGADIVHGWSSFSEPSIKRCNSSGVPFILERGSSHILTQCKLLEEEGRLLGLTGCVTHPKIIEMELAEYAAADRIAVPSRFVERSFLENGVPGEKLFYNPLGVNLTHFTPSGEKKEHATPEFRVIYAGALSYRKGIHYLVRGFKQAAIPGAQLILAGGRLPESELLIGHASDEIQFLGHLQQSALVDHYRRATVFVLASIEEGMAMVQAQALATGLPLICTENTGGEDLLQLIAPGCVPAEEQGGVRRYPAGFVVPIRNSMVIAQCLRRLHQDPALLESQQAAALRIHLFPLDWQSYADRAMKCYSDVLSAEAMKLSARSRNS